MERRFKWKDQLRVWIRVACVVTVPFLSFLRGQAPDLKSQFASDPVRVDGVLEEGVWQRAADLSQRLITWSPAFGERQPELTELWLAHDQTFLYFAIRAHDGKADEIKSAMARRDEIDADDWVGISLDAMGGQQHAVMLKVNPRGVQADEYLTPAGSDPSADYVWQSAARRTTQGYDVEMAVPLKSLRFRGGDSVVMNLLLLRHQAASGSRACWPAKAPSQAFLSVHQPVHYGALEAPSRVELMPAFTWSTQWSRESDGSWSRGQNEGDLGLTAKVGLSSAITIEATVNPDFSQVESDDIQVLVNQRYPIFTVEKRPFFMEAGPLFNLAASDDSGDYNMLEAVHTRSIVDPDWGVRLSGEAGDALYGFMAVRDAWTDGGALDPATITLGRVKWRLGQDDYAGILYSGREAGTRQNDVLALDLSTKWKSHHFSAKAMASATTNDQDTAPDLALTASWGSYTRSLSTFMVFEHVGEQFQMDTAYLQRTGIQRVMGYVAPSFYPAKLSWLKRLNLMPWGYPIHDLNTRADDSLYFLAMRAYFPRQANLRVDLRRFSEFWGGRQLRGTYLYAGGQVQLSNALFFFLSMEAGQKILYDADNPLAGPGLSLQAVSTIQPLPRLAFELSGIYEQLKHPDSGQKLYDVSLFRLKGTYQFTRHLYLRGIVQYDSSQKQVVSDILASLTLIPETVLHIGYGAVRERQEDPLANRLDGLRSSTVWRSIKRSFFFKAGYRFRF